jgi:hypothetical protein
MLDGIEALYREHRRHGEYPIRYPRALFISALDVTVSITTFVIESISAHSMLLDSYVVLHAALISCLHRIIGVEFGRGTLFAYALRPTLTSSCLFRAEPRLFLRASLQCSLFGF